MTELLDYHHQHRLRRNAYPEFCRHHTDIATMQSKKTFRSQWEVAFQIPVAATHKPSSSSVLDLLTSALNP